MIPHTSSAPTKLRIWQQNARKSLRNTDYILNEADPTNYDLILIQEPWFDHLGKSRATHNWRIIYPPTIYNDNRDPIRSIILVNVNISTNAYTQLNIPCSDITGIRLTGEFGNCTIINIYNDCTSNNTTTALRDYLNDYKQEALPLPTDQMLWCGDFNRHHPLWETDTNRHLYNSPRMIEPLIDLITTHDMSMALPPDTPTYETAISTWTRPDNVWRNNGPADPITICDTRPQIRPPLADHLPIYIELDLPISRAKPLPTRNMRKADFKKINENLKRLISDRCPPKEIRTKRELETAVNTLVDAIQEAIREVVPETRPSPFAKRWWTAELTELKREKNKLSKLSYRFRGLPNHPIHAEYRTANQKLYNRIEETKKSHWSDWLENATPSDVYTANKYINSEPSDYSNARIPALKIHNTETNQDTISNDNALKAKALADTFFPPPPPAPIIPDYVYPEPLKPKGTFTRDNIREAVKKLKPYKAPGLDGIQNVVLQECIETIVDNLYYIYRAVLKLNTYPSRWLILLTIVLRKAGKAAYDVAKSYRPIGLLDTLGKLLSTLIVMDLSYLTEKHQLLPATQFGGRLGRCTTDAMHLVIQKIKDAWRRKKVTSILFLDIQAAFPNTVKERLLHNMKTRRVPTTYINLFNQMLSDRQTTLRFDDYTSDPINIDNGTTQGCPLSMLLYAFYNADLIDIANGKHELSTGFVDDCAFVAVGDTLEEAHITLKDMMERANGGLEWSRCHNSKFEISKLAVMDFPRPGTNPPTSPLTIDTHNHTNAPTTVTITNVQTYKYLGVVFDPKLTWKPHIAKITANATRWTQQLTRIAKATGGLSPNKMRLLYNTVAIPALTYAADVWYTPPYKPAHAKKSNGLVTVTKHLNSIQGTAARHITGGIKGTAHDTLQAHANILPMDLLLRRIQFRAASRISSLPHHHPIYPLACKAAKRLVKTHRSPLHYLFYTTQINPKLTETISPTRRHPLYRPTVEIHIDENKEKALTSANTTHNSNRYKAYCDGSGLEDGAGAAAILYKGNRAIKQLKFHAGNMSKHTVYETELLGLLLAFHLLSSLTCALRYSTSIGLDNQASIKAISNQKPKPAQYLMDQVHNAAELLQIRQDRIQRKNEFKSAKRNGNQLTPRKRNVCEIQILWVPGHKDFAPNEKVDELAKQAAQGESSQTKELPAFLRKPLPASLSAIRQESKAKIQRLWARRWKHSPRSRRLAKIDNSIPSKKWMDLVKPLTKKQAAILIQLRTGHIGLNGHLHRIGKINSPLCTKCDANTEETVHHYLFECDHYQQERAPLNQKLRRKAHEISYLLTNPTATLPLLKFIHATGRLKNTFGDITTDNLRED